MYTDHHPLTFIFKRPTKSAHMSKWGHKCDKIMMYEYHTHKHTSAFYVVLGIYKNAMHIIQILYIHTHRLFTASDLIEFLEGKGLPSARIPAALDHFELNEWVLYHVRDIPPGLVIQQVLPSAHPSVYHIYKKAAGL